MFSLDPEQYGERCRPLLDSPPAMDLGPGCEHGEAEQQLRELSAEDLFASPPDDLQLARCCLAALWLRWGYLDRSHEISQQIDSAEGSYWHGIMHRHEPDYSNAKHWFRKVGPHPLFPQLGRWAAEASQRHRGPAARSLASGQDWDPCAFVDWCQQQQREGPDRPLLVELVELEWQALFDYCHRAARSG